MHPIPSNRVACFSIPLLGPALAHAEGKLTHRIDISWKLETAPNRSRVDGRDGIGILVFDKDPAGKEGSPDSK